MSDPNNLIPSQDFHAVVNWLLSMRHDDIRSKFCLISVRPFLGEQVSPAFSSRLALSLRSSDLVCETDNSFWCLLPTDNLDVLHDRLTRISMLIHEEGLIGKHALDTYKFPRFSLHRIKSVSDLFETLGSSSVIPDGQIESGVLTSAFS